MSAKLKTRVTARAKKAVQRTKVEASPRPALDILTVPKAEPAPAVRIAAPGMPTYITARDLVATFGISRAGVTKMVKDGRLPKPIYLGPRVPRWDIETVKAHIAAMNGSA